MSGTRCGVVTAIVVLALAAGVTVFSAAALADPSHNIQGPQTLACDNNTTVVVNPGTVTNRSHEGFVVDSTSILVINYLAFTDSAGTVVLFETAPGLHDLVTCTGDAGGGFTITIRGFFTPRS